MGQAMIGNFDVESSGSMNMDELMRQIYGVPIELKTCGNFRIDQITTMDKAKLDKYIADFKTKISGLKKIMSSSYDGRVKKNNDYFYNLLIIMVYRIMLKITPLCKKKIIKIIR